MAISYTPSPTVAKFFESRAFIKGIMGPVGGGKSTAALVELLQRAFSQEPFNGVRRTKFIILRNTIQQLKSTVKPLIDAWCITMPPTPMGSWRLVENTFEIKGKMPDGTVLHTEFVLMAADTPDDVRRLLSVECSAAWVEEAREVDPEVFAGLQGRTARFPSKAMGGVTYPGVIFSTNPPPLGTFWHELIVKPPKNTEAFVQPAAILDDGAINPAAENLQHLDPDYYDNLLAANKPSWVDVYLKNNFGAGDYGNPVFKGTFRQDFHVAKTNLNPISQSLNPLIIGSDNGLTAGATFMQMDARGRVNVLAEVFVPEGETMGYETFLDKMLIPKLRNEFTMFRAENTVFVVDPACFQRAQLDERTLAMAIQTRGYKVLKAGTNDPERRIAAVEGLLSRQIDGGAGLLIDPRCTHLINGMAWGYRYKKSTASLAVEKNHFSHLAEGFQYACLHYNVSQSGGYRAKPAGTVKRAAYMY